jgi:cytochrome c-type biogenesis protein CcmF
MASLGTYLLLAAFVVSSYAAGISIAGARRRSRRLIESGVGAFYLVAALMTVASAVIVNAFLTDDFSIKYVAHYSDSVQPLFYKITSYWGGLDGSIMFWVFLLSLFGSAAVYVNRERHRELIPYVVATISTVEMFFLYLMIVHKNPFTSFLTNSPADGTGLNPLLQNYWMAIHPPSLYTGFVGMTIPYAFCIAALITGHLDDSWLRAVRRWTMVGWLFLTFGLTLGMIWAYEVLGWGGYWGWDPVENAGLLPWFTATAFLHSVMVQERRSMLRIWNVTLVILTFFLTIFGTFMTRSGVVSSIHAFGDDPVLAKLFVIFMIAILTFSFGLVIYRLPLLQARNEFDSFVSREAAFLLNNWILLFCAIFIAFATMFPTLSEAVTGTRLTVAGPFYTKWMVPIGLILLFLTGVGPLLAWRKSTLNNLRDSFLWPSLAAVVTGAAVTMMHVGFWSSGLCFALCGLVTATIVQEYWRGGNVRRKNTGTDIVTAIIGLVGRNKRRYGGYIVHLGIVLIFLGFAGNGSKREELFRLKPGDKATIGAFTVRNDGVRVADDGQKQMTIATVAIFKDGRQLETMYPARAVFHKHENEESRSDAAIRRSIAEDFYLVLDPNVDFGTQTYTLQAFVNPLVDWIWLGFGVLAFGTGIALLPERAYSFATATVPAGAATTTIALLLIVTLGGSIVRAQQQVPQRPLTEEELSSMPQVDPNHVERPPQNALEEQMRHEIVCSPREVCNCGHRPLAECNCGQAAQMKDQLAEQIRLGKNRDQIREYFVATYGSQEPLGAPLDTGFNRLAWFVPYVMGGVGIVAIGFAAFKWSRHGEQSPSPIASTDPDLDDRINDELRDLD